MYRDGVSGTSLDDVLAASGTGKSQLYHYFADKTDLVIAVVDLQLSSILASQPTIQQTGTWEGLEAWAAQVIAFHTGPDGPQACPLGTLAAELKNDERFRPTLDDAFHRWEAPLAAGLSRLREQGELQSDDQPESLATMLIAALQGGMLLARTRGDIAPLRAVFGVSLDHVRSLRTQQRAEAVDST